MKKLLGMLMALALACAPPACAQTGAQTDRPDVPPPAAEPKPEPKPDAPPAVHASAPAATCAAPLLSAMVTDDPYNTAVEAAEQWRTLRIPAWHATAMALARASRCYTLIDPDPLLLALPGAALPDVILRVRPVKTVLYQKTVGDKIDEGVRGYIESYTSWLGAKSTTDGPPLLSEIGVNVSVLCPRQRRVERDIVATDTAPVQPLIDQNREYTGARQNIGRAERAIAKALDDITGRVARGEMPCMLAPSAAPPAAAPQTPSQTSASALTISPALALPPSTAVTGGVSVAR